MKKEEKIIKQIEGHTVKIKDLIKELDPEDEQHKKQIASAKKLFDELDAALPTDDMTKKVREKIENDRAKAERERMRSALIKKFEDAIATNEAEASRAFKEAKQAVISGNKRAAEKYTRDYAAWKKMAGEYKTGLAEYKMTDGMRQRAELIMEIQNMLDQDLKANGNIDPVEFIRKQEELNRKLEEREGMYGIVMDQLSANSERISSEIDEEAFLAASEEVHTAAQLDMNQAMANSAGVPTVGNTAFSGQAMLDEMKRINDEG